MRDLEGKFIKGHIQTIEARIKMSNAKKARPVRYWLGKKRPDVAKALKGENSHFWKGGITPLNKIIRESADYKIWREAVFFRDGYTCVNCGIKSGEGVTVELQADHIKPFSLFPELRFAIDNGRTLCRDCHMLTPTWGRQKNV